MESVYDMLVIGRQLAVALVQGQLTLNPQGYIVAGEDTKTNLPGVYAVGDVRVKDMHRIVTAASDGAVAAGMAEMYLAAAEDQKSGA